MISAPSISIIAIRLFCFFSLFTLLLTSTSCKKKSAQEVSYSPVLHSGSMKNVKWKGELEGTIRMDTIADQSGVYGLGPVEYLKGEILVANGISYVSTVVSDSTMNVVRAPAVAAPFFVYGQVKEWEEQDLPTTVRDLKTLEDHLGTLVNDEGTPFVFKLKGKVAQALIHIQNLPEGTAVRSPKDAHKGQVKYHLYQESAELIGFYSTQHQGIFTHHDTYLHIHLITEDRKKMGHLDAVTLNANQLKLYLPKGLR